MSKSEIIKWVQNLKKDIGQPQYQDLWHYAEMLDEVIGALEGSDDNQVLYGTDHNCILTMFGECSYNETGCSDCAVAEKIRKALSAEVSEEDVLKFYYVESIDDYWIGKRLDNFYYAEWSGDWFVWTHSRYLPWGEHVVAKDTLWKEHTYPSEPREIPFTEWIVGFMKKYGSEVSEDCISREWVLNRWDKMSVRGRTEFDQEIMVAPSVIPKPKEGEWIDTGIGKDEVYDEMYVCSKCGSIEFYSNYCPNCGARMKGAEDV